MTLQEAIALLETNGFAVVPVEPTNEMLERGWNGASVESAEWTWRYMLNSIPTAADIAGLKVRLSRPDNIPQDD